MKIELNHKVWTIKAIGVTLLYIFLLAVVPLSIYKYVQNKREATCTIFANSMQAKFFYARKEGMCILVFNK